MADAKNADAVSPEMAALDAAWTPELDRSPEEEDSAVPAEPDKTEQAEEPAEEAAKEQAVETEKPLPKELQAALTKTRQKDRAEIEELKAKFAATEKKADLLDKLSQNPRFMALINGEPDKTAAKTPEQDEEVARMFADIGVLDPEDQQKYQKVFSRIAEKMFGPRFEETRQALKEEVVQDWLANEELRTASAAHADWKEYEPRIKELQEQFGYTIPLERAYMLLKLEDGQTAAPSAPKETATKVETPSRDEAARALRKRAAVTTPPGGGGAAGGGAARETEWEALSRTWQQA